MSTTTIYWDARRSAPRLLEELERHLDGDLAAKLSAVANDLPILPYRPAERGPFVRPKGHQRCFFERTQPAGVFGFKGTEPGADDLDVAFDQLGSELMPNRRSILEEFLIREHKVPMALLMSEAIEEATAACDFQEAYLQRYRKLARVPLPLLVLRWSDEAVDSFARRLVPRLSRRAAAVSTRLLAGGLAVYIYYYPSFPERVAQHVPRIDERGFGFHDERRADPLATIESWIRLCAQAVGLGYLPCRLDHAGAGQAIDINNAVIDGGFVDLDSFQKISSIAGERALYETFVYMLSELSSTIRHLLVGSARLEFHPGNRPLDLHIYHALVDTLKSCVREEQARGLVYDERLLKLLFAPTPYHAVVELCRAAFPSFELPDHA